MPTLLTFVEIKDEDIFDPEFDDFIATGNEI
jgi:hypothetical protein